MQAPTAQVHSTSSRPYQITATFAGSHAYGSSFGETYLTAISAPAPTAAPTATPTSVADIYFVPAIAGLFVLIIIVAIVLATIDAQKKTIKTPNKNITSPPFLVLKAMEKR